MDKNLRKPIGALVISVAGLLGILAHEAFSPVAYPDPTYGWQVPTIGYGTTEGVKKGDTITKEQAVIRVKAHIRKDMKTLNNCINPDVTLTQIEYDLFVDFAYNIGTSKLCKSTMVRKLNKFDYAGAWNEYPKWKYSNGRDCSVDRKCRGVYKRRLEAQKLAKAQL
jgi:lysozyme